MNTYLYPPPPVVSLPILDSELRYAVNRIFCVGRNYVDHAKEMGEEVERKQPFFFCKPASAIVESGQRIAYPPGTNELHYEMELVVAIGQGLFQANSEQAKNAVYAYACGLDLTRRDLQARFKQKSHPWDLAKAFENSAVISSFNSGVDSSILPDSNIQLSQNGQVKQRAKIKDMVWKIEELLAYLSHYYHLTPGDLIFTGTPAGVGAILPGDHLLGEIDNVAKIELSIEPNN